MIHKASYAEHVSRINTMALCGDEAEFRRMIFLWGVEAGRECLDLHPEEVLRKAKIATLEEELRILRNQE